MRFTLTIDLAEDLDPGELARILQTLTPMLQDATRGSGAILDRTGKRIGQWQIT